MLGVVADGCVKFGVLVFLGGSVTSESIEEVEELRAESLRVLLVPVLLLCFFLLLRSGLNMFAYASTS